MRATAKATKPLRPQRSSPWNICAEAHYSHVKGEFGELPIGIPRDRNSSFEPQLITKHQTRWAEINTRRNQDS